MGDGLSSALDGVLGLTEAGGIAGVELRWLAIGAVKPGQRLQSGDFDALYCPAPAAPTHPHR